MKYVFLGESWGLAYKDLGGLKMKDFKFVELVLFGSWVRKRHPEMIEQLEDLYDETIHVLSHETQGLKYNRYRAIGFLKPHKKNKYKRFEKYGKLYDSRYFNI